MGNRATLFADLLAIGCGGAVGAILRYGLTRLALQWVGSVVWGTLAANLLGCLAIGVLAGFLQGNPGLHGRGELAIRTGLLGGLTTFSTFALEIVLASSQQRWWATVAQVVGNLGGGIVVLVLGIYVGRQLSV